MLARSLWKPLCCLFLFAAFFPGDGFSGYVEGIDTTDVNGYGLDSAFQIGIYNNISEIIDAYYFVNGWGYFNYDFDDIKMAPEFVKQSVPFQLKNGISNCIIIKSKKDSTFSKVQFLGQVSGKEYIYRYGTNTAPNDRMLTKSDYDRSIRYKPNNLHNSIIGYNTFDSTSWDPPLPSNNHLLGYIFYRSKSGVTIDTTAPIDSAQWDSVCFIDSTYSSQLFPENVLVMPGFYFNLLALYSEGKSDFLLGWTKFQYYNLNVRPNSSSRDLLNSKIEIRKHASCFLISVHSLPTTKGPFSFAVYNINGQQIARFSVMKGNSVLWNPSDCNIAPGAYIANIELPDRTVLSQKFMFSR